MYQLILVKLIKYMPVNEELTLCDGLSTYETKILEIMTHLECVLILNPEN